MPPLDKKDADTTNKTASSAEDRNESGIGLMGNDRIPTVTSEGVAAMELGTETPNPGKFICQPKPSLQNRPGYL